MPQEKILLDGPMFKPRPGWGGQLKAWAVQRRKPLIIIAFIAVLAFAATAVVDDNPDSSQATPTPTPPAEQITVTAQPRDSVTSLARRALNLYLEKYPLELNAVQKLYIETELKNSVGETRLAVGQSIMFSTTAIQRAIEKSKFLSELQVKYFQRFLQ